MTGPDPLNTRRLSSPQTSAMSRECEGRIIISQELWVLGWCVLMTLPIVPGCGAVKTGGGGGELKYRFDQSPDCSWPHLLPGASTTCWPIVGRTMSALLEGGLCSANVWFDLGQPWPFIKFKGAKRGGGNLNFITISLTAFFITADRSVQHKHSHHGESCSQRPASSCGAAGP
ncbi:hypothetical protein RRG08_008308 [Elysia crispata]|uniref:Uncharacterized protein n=1 Tax=Elysia crispata TaxID=231223 RepID=A0AAE0ZMJ2_9GAST|nr:hypothetical protein RRG08_008308 [Elysia crispata]